MQQLGGAISSLSGAFDSLGAEQAKEQDFADKMVMLKTDNEIGLSEVQSRQTYQGTGDDYLPSRNQYYDTTTQSALEQISERNRPKAQIFFEQRKGPYIEGAARFGGERRQQTLIGTIDDTIATEYGKLATVPVEEFEGRFLETTRAVDLIINNAPLPDALKENLAGQAAERAYGVIRGLAEDPETAPEVLPKILKLIEEPPQEQPTVQPQLLKETQPDPRQGLPGGQSGPAQLPPPGRQGGLQETPQTPISAAANAGKAGHLGKPGQNLTTLATSGGAKFTVNKAVAPNFQGFLNELEAAGYKVDPKQSGGYNYRKIRGGRALSEHAYGNAIDINWTANARGTKGNMPENVGQIAAKYGLTWGGNWKNPDAMHFEWNPAHKVAAGGPFGAGPMFAKAAPGTGSAPKPTLTAYSPQRGGDKMEGGYAAARPGPNGKAEVMTLADVAAGRSDYVTLAGDKTQFGKTYTIPEITYRDKNGALITLKNVKGVVHDTGSTFRGRGESRFDIPVDRDLAQSDINKQPFSKTKVAFLPAGEGAPAVAERGLTRFAGLSKAGLGDVEPQQRAPNTIPGAPNEANRTGEIQVADASGRILPSERVQTYRSVQSQLRDKLIKNFGTLKRMEQHAIDRAEREEEQRIKEAQQVARDEGLRMLIDGTLTDEWVGANADRLTARDAYTLVHRLHSGQRILDPQAYSERMLAIDSDPKKALSDAFNDLAEGRISVGYFKDIEARVNRTLKSSEQGQNMPDWAKRLKGEFFEQIGTHQGDSWKRIERSQDAMKEFTDYLSQHMEAGTLDYDKAKKRMQEGIQEYKTGRVRQKRSELPALPRKWTSATPDNMTLDEVEAAKGRLIQKLNEELAASGGDTAAKRQILQRYQEDGRLLQSWEKLLREQAEVVGEKPQTMGPPRPPGMMKLGGPKQTAQESPSEHMQKRDYPDKEPPIAPKVQVMTPEMGTEYFRVLSKKADEFRAQGYSQEEALTRAQSDPDVKAVWRRLMKNAPSEIPSDSRPLPGQ